MERTDEILVEEVATLQKAKHAVLDVLSKDCAKLDQEFLEKSGKFVIDILREQRRLIDSGNVSIRIETYAKKGSVGIRS
jgi:hypothetical protein